jgi:hypothetical protein
MNLFNKILLPILIVFAILTAAIFSANKILLHFNADKNVLLGANVLFLLLGIIVFFIQQKALQNPNPNVFIRSIIAGTMIKMFTTVLAVLAYVVATGNDYSKAAVFISLFMYLIYLAAEVIAITKVNSKKNG